MDRLASRCGLRKQLTLELRLPTWFQHASDLLGRRKDDMHYKAKHIYIGIDLHKKTHTAVVVNCWHEKLGEVTFENKPSAFPELIAFVKRFRKRGITPIYGLEDVGGYGRSLAVYLLEQKQQVKEVNSALSYAERKSHPSPQKSDSWDAECVAKILLNKLDILPEANPQDVYWTIGQLVTRRNGLIKALTSLKNQLHMQLSYHYPSYKKFFSELDGKCALAFWHKYPSPYLLKGETVETLAHFLRLTSNNACSTRKAEQLLAWIQADGDTTRTYQEQRDFLIRSHVRDIRFNKKEIAHVEGELHSMMQQLDLQLETMPGIDLVTSSALVAEIGDINRFPSADKLARFAGIAPVNFSSGGKGTNQKSRQGNRVLHGLFYNLAVQQVQVSKGSKKPRNPLFYEYFNRKKEEGKTPTQALVCVMRRLVNIIYGMMKHKTAFRLPEQVEKQAS
ncbi:transposase [Paenibacillus alvei]|uniref:Transposase n=2 Tax=Paenibacillus alvei TaxID=44250 RepID=A0A383RCL3_PAEAL|nr:transposase [Paenibacillus alvei]